MKKVILISLCMLVAGKFYAQQSTQSGSQASMEEKNLERIRQNQEKNKLTQQDALKNNSTVSNTVSSDPITSRGAGVLSNNKTVPVQNKQEVNPNSNSSIRQNEAKTNADMQAALIKQYQDKNQATSPVTGNNSVQVANPTNGNSWNPTGSSKVSEPVKQTDTKTTQAPVLNDINKVSSNGNGNSTENKPAADNQTKPAVQQNRVSVTPVQDKPVVNDSKTTNGTTTPNPAMEKLKVTSSANGNKPVEVKQKN